MAEYKILFVDEVESDIRRFQRYVHRKDIDKKFNLIVEIPENTLDNFMNKINPNNISKINNS